jgi:phage/plasmid-like protein (TIGR03299 family)
MTAEFEEGFFVREPAWHGLGVVLPEYPGREEAIRLAGHAWQVVERPVRIALQNEPIAGWKALIREDTGGVLNIVRDSYTVVQNTVLWDIVDALVDQPEVKYETAGLLRGGAVAWALAKVDRPGQVTGDDSKIYPYIAVATTHDGTGALKAQNTSVRIVCMNTYQYAADQTRVTGREYVFRHTAKVAERIEDAKLALAGVVAAHEAFLELAEELARLPVGRENLEWFLTKFIPDPKELGIERSERVFENIQANRAQVRAILEAGSTIPDGHRGTAFGLFEASLEYLDHIRPSRSAETKFNRSILRQERQKDRLLSLVRASVGLQ